MYKILVCEMKIVLNKKEKKSFWLWFLNILNIILKFIYVKVLCIYYIEMLKFVNWIYNCKE